MSLANNVINEAMEFINHEFPKADLTARLDMVSQKFASPVFTTSLGKEDQAITSAIAPEHNIRLVTFNTGRLFEETQKLLEATRQSFSIKIEELHPRDAALADYIGKFGRDGFYESLEARHACCHVRKIEPLKRVLAKADAWVTGLRRGQSAYRANHLFAEWDEGNGLVKVNPLADWSGEQLDDYLQSNKIPVNPLHNRGYPSIGCEPCTRAIKPGEDERAGRWWWERDDKRECGLHTPSNEAPLKVSAQ